MYGKSYQVTYWDDPGVSYPDQHWVVLEITWSCSERHRAEVVSRHYNRPDAEMMARELFEALDA